MKRLVSCIFICSLHLFSHSQSEVSLPFQRLGIEEGLPNVNIKCIEQDAEGFLWIGTTNGLSRYDGAEFKNFFHHISKNSIPGNYISEIKNYDSRHIIIATSTGLSIINIHTLEFKNFLVSSKAFMFNLENNFLCIAIDANKNIWAGTQTTLYCLSPAFKVLSAFRGYSEKDFNLKRMIYVDKIKILTDNQVMARLQYKEWENAYFLVNRHSGSLRLFQNLREHSLHILSQARDFVFSEDKETIHFIKGDSLFYFQPYRNKIGHFNFAFNNNQAQHSFKNADFLQIDDQTVACRFLQGGFVIIPFFHYSKTKLPPKTVHLKDQFINSLKKDKEGNLWAATDNGLFKLVATTNNLASVSINPISGNPALEGLRKIFFINDSIWLSTSSSGFFITTRQLTPQRNILLKGNKDLNITWSVVETNAPDTVWVNTQFGIRWYNTWQNSSGVLQLNNKPAAMDNQPITGMMKDSKGLIWMGIGFSNGLVQFNPTTRSVVHYSSKTQINPLPIRYPLTIAEDFESNLWMANMDGTGVVRWKRNTNQFELIAPDYTSVFDNASIQVLYCNRKKILWLGSISGLFRYNIPLEQFTKYEAPSGLVSGYIYSICEDAEGRLWIGTNYGISCFLPNENRFVNFTQKTGMPQSKINDVTYDSVTKKIFFTTDHYFASFIPGQLLELRTKLMVKITGVRIANKNKTLTTAYTLPYNENDIGLFFTAVNLTDGQANEYFYSINDKEWISTGKQRQINFTNVSPGHYKIALKAINSLGGKSTNEAIITFTIKAPLWKSWGFYLACAAVVALLFYSLYRYRINEILKWQKARDRIATDLHDDIGSTLTNISILSELSNKSLKHPEEAAVHLQRISEEVIASGQALDDIIWSVNSNHDTLEEMFIRMRRFAAELFDSSNVHCKLELKEGITQRKINLEQKRDIYLIYKESLNNIYKHANAQKVYVELAMDKDSLTLLIHDDGKGFNPEIITERNGLKNLKTRVKKWNGSINITSMAGKGTYINIRISVLR